MFVVFDAGAVLIAPALTFSINAAWFHKFYNIDPVVSTPRPIKSNRDARDRIDFPAPLRMVRTSSPAKTP
jgi:hypothetical protein